jgi:antagonist of KipI
MIRVAKSGLATTVQDLGRFGFAHLGLSPCGAADPLSFRIANLLVGNGENTPALEMTLMGATLEFERNAVVAITGAACNCKIGSYRVPMFAAVEVPAGGVLQCGTIADGARLYLAVQGGIDVPLIMGSASTDTRGKFGGFDGRPLRVGDVLRVGTSTGLRSRIVLPHALDALRRSGLIRVTRGSQADWFARETFLKFLASEYRVTEQADRAGLRLAGEAVVPRERRQLLTDGIPLGAIQVPQDGQPIILFVDQQTTGGYPKIANVIAADMHRIGQLRPRDEVRFVEVSFAAAVDALRAQEQWFKGIWQG